MSKYSQRHVALSFGYMGDNYRGLAAQPHLSKDNTIEFHIFKALKKLCLIESRENCNYSRCGRTDKGVSATGQVISLTLRSNLTSNELKENPTRISGGSKNELNYAALLNRVLPDDIFMFGWAPCLNPNFNARFQTKNRTYRYFFSNVYDVELMAEAAEHFIGVHDFRNFCKIDVANVQNFTREVFSFDIKKLSAEMYCAEIKGNAFLWHQIRCMMAVLFLVGKKLEAPDVVKSLLDISLNPARPEYLMASEYPLVLDSSEYDDLNFFYDPIALKKLDSALRAKRQQLLIQLAKYDNAISKLAPIYSTEDPTKEKQYVPLLERKRCKSFEERLTNLTEAKKQKIFRVHGRTPGDILNLT
eukprot:snap_masked-scaffold_1-processed-gene-30.18-mRNA-1 protein AED:0.44 eAED:0.44 QI:0/-1/0/1/-1/1/1/0/358